MDTATYLFQTFQLGSADGAGAAARESVQCLSGSKKMAK